MQEALAGKRIHVRRVEAIPPSLEDVFVSLTALRAMPGKGKP